MNNFTTCSEKGNKVESKQGRFTRVLRACTMVAAMLLMVAGISLDAAAQSVKSCAVKKAPSASMTLKGGMPQSAKVQATKVDRSTSNGKHVYGAYDITITNGTAEWQPAGGAPVMVSITDPNFADGTLLDVYHEGTNGNEFVATVSPTNHTITFPAHSFSVYIVGESDDVARLKVNFVQSGGNTVSIYVKPADIGEHFNSIVYDPGVGVLASGVHFRGWTTNQNYTIDAIAQGKTIAEVRDEVQTELQSGVSEGDEITYYAMLIKSYSITYLDENNAAIGASEIAFRADDQSGSAREYTVSNAYTPGDNMHNFEGWFIRSGGSNVQEYTGPEQNFENGTTIHVSGDVVFGVNSAEGHWLIYRENGKGATYKAADFVKSGEVTVEPTINMIRPGYTFQGWFLGPLDATNVENPVPTGAPFVFGQQLTDNTEIFAKWQANTTAGYTVIIWRQNLAGNGYDYVEAISLTGNVGATINTVTQQGTGNNAYARVNGVNKQYTGFHLNNFDQNVTIKTEGNSVVNVYYDRNVHTLTFQVEQGYYNPQWTTIKTINARYGQNIGDNFPIVGTDGTEYTNDRWAPQNSSLYNQVLVYIDIMPDADVTFHRDASNAGIKTMNYYVEALPGETPAVTRGGVGYTLYRRLQPHYNFITEAEDYLELQGFTKNGTDPAFNNQGRITANTANFYYLRDEYPINFMDGSYFDGNGNRLATESSTGQIDVATGLTYGADISSYNDYNPSEVPTGYVFEGWYVDATCSQPFNFTTMPDGGLTVFAKWRQIQYRVFLHPNADHITALDWGSDNQAMNFRISYGGQISAPTGVDGNGNYEFVGWYTDAALLNAFSEDAVVLNEQTVTTPYDKTTDFTDPMDKWGNGATSNSDITGNQGTDRFWITKKYDIYGKWRAVLNGANGIDVEYVANGGDESTLPSDDNLYQDNVDATAGAACSYVDNSKVFSHWVVQKWNAEQEEYQDLSTTVFPGAPFTVLKDNAKMDITGYANPNDPEDISETEDATHTNLVATYTVRLRAEWVDAETHTPTFIVWYNNYEGAATDTLCQYGKINDTDPNADLHINEAKNIPTPAARDGYTFKGWFKKQWQPNETVTTTIQECTPNFLTYENGNYYSVPAEGETAVQATQVAADEANPYDYLYAIWEPTVEFTSPVKYCQNTTGSLPTPTTAPEDLTFTWSLNGNTVTTVNTQTAGTFTYTWTTADGCKTGEVQVVVNPLPTITATATPATICAGSESQLSATGATSYKWDAPATPEVDGKVSPSETTTYHVTGTDANGCVNYAEVTVTVISTPEVTLTGADACFGNAATITPALAEGSSTPTHYKWSTDNAWSAWPTTGAPAAKTFSETGDYSAAMSVKIQIDEERACEATSEEVTVKVNPMEEVTVNGSDFCEGSSTELSVAQTETAITSYKWSDNSTGEKLTVSEAGTYSVTVTFEGGCTATGIKTVAVLPTPEISLSDDDIVSPTCTKKGSLEVTVTGGTTPYTYYNNTESVAAQQTSPYTIGNLDAGNYSVYVADANGCISNTIEGALTVNPEEYEELQPTTIEICSGSQFSVTPEGATDGMTYSWSAPTATGVSGLEAGEDQGTVNGTLTVAEGTTGVVNVVYTVTPTIGVCPLPEVDMTVKVTANVHTPATLTLSALDTACANSEQTVTATIENSTAPATLTWSYRDEETSVPVESGVTSATFNPSTALEDGCAGTFTLTLKYEDNICPAVTTSTEVVVGVKQDWKNSITDAGTIVACASEAVAPGADPIEDICENTITPKLTKEPSEAEIKAAACGGELKYEYTYTDCAGNSKIYTYTYTIEKPVLTFNGTINNIENENACYSEEYAQSKLLTAEQVKAMYSSNCNRTITVSVSDAPGENNTNCSWSYTRTFTISDSCNTVTKTQSVSGGDKTAPVINTESDNWVATIQAERGADCSYVVPDLTSMVKSSATDNCTEASALTVTQTPEAGTTVSETTTVTVTVADACTNSSEETVSITIPESVITVTTPTKSWIYDGQSHSEAIFTLTNGNVTETDAQSGTEVALPNGDKATVTVSGSVTNVSDGEVTNAAEVVVKDAEGTDVTCYYTITENEGKLSITKRDVTLTSADDSKKYDGTALTNNNVTVSGDGFVEGEGATYTVTGTQTNVGESENEFTFALNEGTLAENYEISTQFGTLEVTKREVTLASASDTKEYDGNPLTNDEITVGGDGFAEGEGATYDVTGTQTLVGSSTNTFTYTLNEGTSEDNYTITKTEGTLTVTDRTERYPIEVVSNSETVTYDGEEHTAEGFETLSFTTVDGNDYTVEGLTATVTKTDAGTYDNTITGTPVVKDEDGNDVTAQFDVTLVNGKLVINPANLVIELDSTKIYDGTKFVVSYEQLHVTGLVSRDHITGGTVTSEDYVVGVYRCEEGGFQLMNVEGVAIKEGFAIDNGLGNYVPKFNVTLRIVEREITVTAHSASKAFDGTALTEDGYDTENVAEGDAVAVTITGEQICMGTSANVPSDAVITRTADNDRDVTDSYIVNYVNGTLTVTEAEADAFTCPEAETKTMKDCELTMTVTVEGEPTVDGIAEGSYTVENNLAELNPMSEGVHEITWTMKDNCGNVVASCTQTVTLQYGECTGTAGYEAVRIGSQCWMKENLKDEVGTYKAYKDDAANLEKFGYLYTWYTAMGLEEGDDSTDPWAGAPTDACGNPYVQGICPDGWAVGSDADYALLGATAGNASFLKDPSTEYWLPEKAGVVEGNLGFNARGGGWYNSTLGDFEDIYAAFRYWTPDSEPGAYATSGSINYFCGTPQTLTNKKSDMMSVRCIRKVQPNE